MYIKNSIGPRTVPRDFDWMRLHLRGMATMHNMVGESHMACRIVIMVNQINQSTLNYSKINKNTHSAFK